MYPPPPTPPPPYSYFTSVMPRGLDSVPNLMKLLLGVIIQSLIILCSTIIVLRYWHHRNKHPGRHEAATSRQAVDAAPRKDNSGPANLISATDTTTAARAENNTKKDGHSSLVARKVCCSKVFPACEALVSPGLGNETDSDAKGDNRGPIAVKAASGWGSLKARHLDGAFFLVAFLGNTGFLLSLFFRL